MTTQAKTNYTMHGVIHSYDIKGKSHVDSIDPGNSSRIISARDTTVGRSPLMTQAHQTRIRRFQQQNENRGNDVSKPQQPLQTIHDVKLQSNEDTLSPTTKLIRSRADQAKYLTTSDMPDRTSQHQQQQSNLPQRHDLISESDSRQPQTAEPKESFLPDLDGTEDDSDQDRSFFMMDAFASHNTNSSNRMTRRQKIINNRTQRKRTNNRPPKEPSVVDDDSDAVVTVKNNVRQAIMIKSESTTAPAETRSIVLPKVSSSNSRESIQQSIPVFRRPSPVDYRLTRLTPSTSSSSDTDAKGSYEDSQMMMMRNPTRSELSASAITPDVAAFFHQQSSSRSERSNTYDDEDDDVDDSNSHVSLSYQQRRVREEMEIKARKDAVNAAKAEMRSNKFMQKEDVESYRKTLETPIAKTVAIVTAAAFVGCVVLGPVGLLVGAAAVGIGAGAMQIPAEQRNHMMKSAQESAISVGDAISHSCINTYKDSGIAEHVPADIQSCCVTMDVEANEPLAAASEVAATAENDESIEKSRSKIAEQISPEASTTRVRNRKGRVACLREGRIMAASHIHALSPVLQPKAWLDVLSSAEATHDDRVEAMEEVMILAKDKVRARVLVDEGILDSLMWMIGRFTEKAKYNASAHETTTAWAYPEISREEKHAARLAATCCLTLGKSYCAAMHTEGDLLLMSQYERGTVPEERQLAQMLFEVPHHVRITRTDDPTIVEPSKEVFALRQMTLPQAEELAASIKEMMESMD